MFPDTGSKHSSHVSASRRANPIFQTFSLPTDAQILLYLNTSFHFIAPNGQTAKFLEDYTKLFHILEIYKTAAISGINQTPNREYSGRKR